MTYQTIYLNGKKYVRIHQGRLTHWFYPLVLCYTGFTSIHTDWNKEPVMVQSLRFRYTR